MWSCIRLPRIVVLGSRVAATGLALSFAGAPAGTALAVPAAHASDARIVGRVLVCNTPDRCLTRSFRVSALDARGDVVASSTSVGRHNRYRLRVPAGSYSLLAISNGLRCSGSVEAPPHQTVTADITCPAP